MAKTALITGASSGLGAEYARQLAAKGAHLVLVARDRQSLEQLAPRLRSTYGVEVEVLAADLLKRRQRERVEARVADESRPIEILVNNAGLTRDNILLRLSDEDWDTVLDANLKGAFHTTRAVIKGMMKRRSGRIINITSIVGLIGNKGQANYAASKAGLIGFTKSIAKEYASRNVLANCIAPGFIETDMTSALPEEARASLLQAIALGRLGQAGDVADAVLFLASGLSGYITGQVLVVDGGMVL